jgi:uncharacterized protein involved in response to NO
MRRLLLVLAVGLMMVAMMLVMAVPALARGGGSNKPPNFIPDKASDTVAN